VGKSLGYPLTYETSATSPPNVSNWLKHPLTYAKPVKTPPRAVLKAGFAFVSGFASLARCDEAVGGNGDLGDVAEEARACWPAGGDAA
jgi:hypothetical protein